jgi:diguanylate cyclase (GGDEF)-like protein/PAS domain S-box-containing protein
MAESKKEMETDSAVYKTLLESTKAIPWKIDWQTMAFAYIGPQIEELLGWEQQSWLSVNDWAERIHPEDRERVVNFCVSQSKAGIDHEADYRALTKEGGYVWIRDVVHVVRENGEVSALVGFMFDISERKKNEQKLIKLQKELEMLSLQDGLTGVSNRRMFDSILQAEWANGKRSQEPMSMIMFDIDYFKQYNDHYGHLQGDNCLKTVAQVLQTAAREGDMFARYGGEEFILMLPNCDEEAAGQVAERCRNLVRKRQIPHLRSSVAPFVTVSIGVATMTPGDHTEPDALIAAADAQLYRAKHAGRDRIEGPYTS